MKSEPHFVIVGHDSCHNRGCEALARTAIMVLKEQWPNAFVSVVSAFPEHDAPLMEFDQVDIIPGISVLSSLLSSTDDGRSTGRKVLDRASRVAVAGCPSLGKWLNQPIPEQSPVKVADFRRTRHLISLFQSATAVISIGGDLFIEDYGPPFMAMEQLELAQHIGVPTLVWGASIWPLKTKWIEERIRTMLTSCTRVFVRDGITVQYLMSLGITTNVIRVADGAFLMPAKQPASYTPPQHSEVKLVVGFNGSSLIGNYLSRPACQHAITEMAAFCDELIVQNGALIYLIPHDGPPGAREREFLFEFRELLKMKERAILIPAGLNAPQTKYYIGLLDVFVAMRFHPSIAALSQGIPTLGLSHSPKFMGLHETVFNHTRYLLPYDRISRVSLRDCMSMIIKEIPLIRAQLRTRVPELQALANSVGIHAAAALADK